MMKKRVSNTERTRGQNETKKNDGKGGEPNENFRYNLTGCNDDGFRAAFIFGHSVLYIHLHLSQLRRAARLNIIDIHWAHECQH